MLRPPKYNFSDVLWAPARSFGAKKILVMTLFLILGLAWFDIMTYLSVSLGQEKVSMVFSVYGFFPFADLNPGNGFAQAVHFLAPIGALLLVMLGFFAVATFEIEEARGHRFLSPGKAIRFAFSRFKQICLSELAMLLFMAIIVLLFAVLGSIGRVPWIGEYIYAVTSIIPGFIVAVLAVFVFAVFQMSFILLPATAAADRNGEVFGAILETFSTVIRQPLRWLGYTAYGLIAAKVCGFIYAYTAFRAIQFSTWSAQIGGGERLEKLVRGGLSHLPVNSELVEQTLSAFPGVNWSFSLIQWSRSGDNSAASYVMAAMLFVVFASVIGYMLTIVASSQARAYIVLRYYKDGYKIGNEPPMFFEEEHINPPVEESVSGSSSN